jgi:hypothetical protein
VFAKSETCVALVTNRSHFQRCLLTIWQLRWFGKYRGDVVVVVGDDLRYAIPSIQKLTIGVIPVYFPDIDREEALTRLKKAENTSHVVFTKPFQFHKIYCFSTFFKNWKKVLYMDTKMRVFHPIQPLLELDCSNSVIAHSDAFPEYSRSLGSQFNLSDFPEMGAKIEALAPLTADYFQTGMMLYDTALIDEGTVDELIELSQEFFNANSNEQAIMNLWAERHNLWKKLPTEPVESRLLYDYWERDPHTPDDYILLKYPKAKKEDLWRRSINAIFKIYWRGANRKISERQAA